MKINLDIKINIIFIIYNHNKNTYKIKILEFIAHFFFYQYKLEFHSKGKYIPK